MASSLGYPTSFGGDPAAAPPLLPLDSLTSSAVAAILSTLGIPWHLFLRWLSWSTGLAVRSVTTLGAPPPSGFLPASKLTELNSILNHMHAREDLYRRAIRELQEELDAKDSDRKKALRKLRSRNEEIEALTGRLNLLQRAYERNDNVGGGRIRARSGAKRDEHGDEGEEEEVHLDDFDLQNGTALGPQTHAPLNYSSSRKAGALVDGTVAAAAVAVWFFSKADHAALHWKLVFSLFFPLLWLYVSWCANGRRCAQGPPFLLLSASWFLVGFAVALTLGGGL